jgi:tetratricopeptide (TPR) repeat protein
VAIDRDVVLKQAEKLLRQGKLEGAIAEYVRLIDDQPQDWNSINALGDLYARAGRTDRAVEQYTRVADHLFDDGFLPKAAALYKKALKIKADDEHTLLRLAEIAARQEVFVDARGYLKQLSAQRQARGDERGALDCLVRLGSLEEADPESQVAGARAAEALGDAAGASRLFALAAAAYDKKGRTDAGLDAMSEAARLAPEDRTLRAELVRQCIAAGQPERAGSWLTRDVAGDDPDLLLMLGRAALAAGRTGEARVVLTRLITVAPERRGAIATAAEEVAAGGQVEAAYAAIELVVDDAVLGGDWDAAIVALQTFAATTPHVPALLKLVEIAVDAGNDAATRRAQALLADAYLAAGQPADARAIAEDLVAFDAHSDEHLARLRRVVDLLGTGDADEIIARYREPIDPVPTESVDSPQAVAPEPEPEPVSPSMAEAVGGPEEQREDELDVDLVLAAAPSTKRGSAEDVDLSEDLVNLPPAAQAPTPTPPPPVSAPLAPVPPAATSPAPDLEELFERLREVAAGEPQTREAAERLRQGIASIERGRVEQGIGELQAAARAPLLRFEAAARLGRTHMSKGDFPAAIEWLERAAQTPATNPDEGRAVLYELASALQQAGETSRALAVLMEIDADSAAYRDVPQRIEQLRTADRT